MPVRRTVMAGVLVIALAAGCGGGAGPVPPTPSAPANLAADLAGQVKRLRTATIEVSVERLNGVNGANLTGTVEYSANGVRADLTGTISGKPAHVIVAGDRLYVAQLFQLPSGKAWADVPVGGDRGTFSYYWVTLDQITDALTYVADDSALAGLAFNAAPPGNVDGVSVRTAVVTVPQDRLLSRISAPQLKRYRDFWGAVSGAQFQVSVGGDSIPRRLLMTLTAGQATPSVELHYTGWGSTTVKIDAPSGADVLTSS